MTVISQACRLPIARATSSVPAIATAITPCGTCGARLLASSSGARVSMIEPHRAPEKAIIDPHDRSIPR